MEPTVSGLAGTARLGLTLRTTSQAGQDRRISWVHASELLDPTPFLAGGELLLITGLSLPEDADGQAAYVLRLAKADLVGLGFGVELGHDRIPEALLEAAERHGLPVLEVPHRTPFIEISKAVSQAIEQQRHAETMRGESARQALTKAAQRTGDLNGVLGELATLLDCWAVLLDGNGEVLYACPTDATARVTELGADLARLRTLRAPSSVGLCGRDGDGMAVHSLGGGSGPLGFLVIGRANPLSATDHHIVHVACSLLAVALTQTRAVLGAREQLRSAALRLLLDGHATTVRALPGAELRPPAEPVVVFVSADSRPPEGVFAGTLDGQTAGETDGETDGETVGVLPARADLNELRPPVGLSEPASLDEFRDAYRQARLALRDGVRRGAPITRFGELGAGLLEHVGAPEVAERAGALLRPLWEHDRARRGELVRSLWMWLQHHGQWDPAAAKLGVHRHTLRHRITKVGELLGRGLDSPDVRAELWLALRLHEAPDC